VQVVRRVLVITRHVGYSINLKESLERDGRFVVTAFASAQNALSFLRTTPQDVAIVDFTVRDMSGERIVEQIRLLQADIGIIVAPKHPTIEAAVSTLNVQGVVDLPMPIRQLVTLLEAAIQDIHDAQTDTQTLFPVGDDIDTAASAVDGEEARKQSEALFQKLLSEEPPIPSFEESVTLNDLRPHLLMSALEAQQDDPEATPTVTQDSKRILAAQILEATNDTSTPIEGYDVPSFMGRIGEYQPSPYANEPDFLPDDLPAPPALDEAEALDYTATTTSPAQSAAPYADPQTLETERLVPIARSRPAREEDLMPATLWQEEDETALEQVLTSVDSGVLAPAMGQSTAIDDPRLAQMALNLTQLSLELTAEALVLLRDGAVIAYSGQLPRQDIEDMRALFVNALTEEGQPPQIDYITSPSTGADYMLYAQRTQEGYVLALLFVGTMPVGAIRRQGKRLLEAMAAVPELHPRTEALPAPVMAEEAPPAPVMAEEAPPAPVMAEEAPPATPEKPRTLLPFSFMWLLRHPQQELTSVVAQKLVAGMDAHLTGQGWQVYRLDVYEDFIYLRADAPDDVTPQAHIRHLMNASAQIAHAVNPAYDTASLWSDSYLIMPSEREMGVEELQEFINFVRDA
jgi:ActR/RegA family two-component response regulator